MCFYLSKNVRTLDSPCSRTKLGVVKATTSARANISALNTTSAPSLSAPQKSCFHTGYTTTWRSRPKGPEREQFPSLLCSLPHPRQPLFEVPCVLPRGANKHGIHVGTLQTQAYSSHWSALGFLLFNVMNLGGYFLHGDGQTFGGALPDPFSTGC